MIAKNYRKFPEALRMQRELFLVRVVTRLLSVSAWCACVAPEWLARKSKAARDLAKLVRAWCMELEPFDGYDLAAALADFENEGGRC